MTILKTFIIISLCSYVSAVQFKFTPSPNIGVYQLAHYQCSVDHTGVATTWNVNGTASNNDDVIQLSIVTIGAGSSNSNLTIPGHPQYNNTVVRCFAAGFVDGSLYSNFDDTTLRIQGELAAGKTSITDKLPLSSSPNSNAVQFIFTPSPNIGVCQLAHYQCSVNHTGVGITWNINGTASTNGDIIQLGIVTIGAGSNNSSLTIPGYPQYNNTVVFCIAYGLLDVKDDNSSYYNFDNATLIIQAAVNTSTTDKLPLSSSPNSKDNKENFSPIATSTKSNEVEATSTKNNEVEATSTKNNEVEATSTKNNEVEATSTENNEVEATSTKNNEVEATSTENNEVEATSTKNNANKFSPITMSSLIVVIGLTVVGIIIIFP